MEMSIRQKSLQALAMAGVIAMMLFLAGCGGGGGMAETPETPEPPPAFMLPESSGMFRLLNGLDITNDDAAMQEQMRVDEVGKFVIRMNRSIFNSGTPDTGGDDSSSQRIIGATASWIGRDITPNDPVVDDELRITLTTDGITSLTTKYSESNFNEINGFDDVFESGFAIWREGGTPEDQARAIVFTDKQQSSYGTVGVVGVDESNFQDEPYDEGIHVIDWSSASDEGRIIRGVKFFESQASRDLTEDNAYDGYLECPTGSCSTTVTPTGDIILTGTWYFTGYREKVDPVPEVPPGDDDDDYLLFGLWLHETSKDASNPDALESFGAFADGGRELGGIEDPALTGHLDTRTGKASYSGKAFGAHHMGGVISWFDADAQLAIDFGVAGDNFEAYFDGVITGEISNIRIAGNDPLVESIHLLAPYGGTSRDDIISSAVMGPKVDDPDSPLRETWSFNGKWDPTFYGTGWNQIDGIAGTFALANSEETETFVGSFGARIEE